MNSPYEGIGDLVFSDVVELIMLASEAFDVLLKGFVLIALTAGELPSHPQLDVGPIKVIDKESFEVNPVVDGALLEVLDP